jgi:hypothetical protein
MYGSPRYPYPPQAPPPRPHSQGVSGLTIALIVLGVLFVLGAGSCVVCTGLVGLGASSGPASGRPAATATPVPAAPLGTAGTLTPGAAGGPVPNDEPAPAAGLAGNGSSGAVPPPRAPAGRFFCNATGFVRVCGFANVCNNQMVSGTGSSSDRGTATAMAQNACRGQILARGGSGSCSVACSFR